MLERSARVAEVTKATSGPEAMTMNQCLLRGGAMSPQEVRNNVSLGGKVMSSHEEVRNNVSSGGGVMSPHEVRSSVSSGGKEQQSAKEGPQLEKGKNLNTEALGTGRTHSGGTYALARQVQEGPSSAFVKKILMQSWVKELLDNRAYVVKFMAGLHLEDVLVPETEGQNGAGLPLKELLEHTSWLAHYLLQSSGTISTRGDGAVFGRSRHSGQLKTSSEVVVQYLPKSDGAICRRSRLPAVVQYMPWSDGAFFGRSRLSAQLLTSSGAVVQPRGAHGPKTRPDRPRSDQTETDFGQNNGPKRETKWSGLGWSGPVQSLVRSNKA
uniref:Uncharacterized protein n=1 Tax=Tanacetum cinerariifolium TaxID=118510 RepID=A0A6L2MDH4_TANCI|nr:hypothetical protein [Tanacetum cinerariifolium]